MLTQHVRYASSDPDLAYEMYWVDSPWSAIHRGPPDCARGLRLLQAVPFTRHPKVQGLIGLQWLGEIKALTPGAADCA